MIDLDDPLKELKSNLSKNISNFYCNEQNKYKIILIIITIVG